MLFSIVGTILFASDVLSRFSVAQQVRSDGNPAGLYLGSAQFEFLLS
jgi:hypothetical protein